MIDLLNRLRVFRMRGDRLREMREKHGLSQADLAERVNVASQQILRYENGKNLPSSAVLSAFSKELEVSSDYLLGLVEMSFGVVVFANATVP